MGRNRCITTPFRTLVPLWERTSQILNILLVLYTTPAACCSLFPEETAVSPKSVKKTHMAYMAYIYIHSLLETGTYTDTHRKGAYKGLNCLGPDR